MKQSQARDKQQSLLSWVGKKGTEKSQGARTITKEEEKYQQEIGNTIAKETVAEVAQAMMAIFCGYLNRIRTEYPTQLEGRDKNAIREQVEAATKEIKAELEQELSRRQTIKPKEQNVDEGKS